MHQKDANQAMAISKAKPLLVLFVLLNVLLVKTSPTA